MSRILFVHNDPRKPPNSAGWWRLSLPRNHKDGTFGYQHSDEWAGYIEYYDGRNDWIFPYALRVKATPIIGAGFFPVGANYSLDILADCWDMHKYNMRWQIITGFGVLTHPDTLIQ